MTTFTVPGPPVPWARARRVGNRYFVDAKTAAHKAAVERAAWAAGVKLIEKPHAVSVTMSFHLPRPKRGKYTDPIDRRDLDNLAKGCLDAMNGLAFDDDGQVCRLFLEKRYDREPCTIISVNALDA